MNEDRDIFNNTNNDELQNALDNNNETDVNLTASYEYIEEETIPPFQANPVPPQPQVYTNQPNNPNWTMQPTQMQQTDWSYNQYGTLGTSPQTPPKTPKPSKPTRNKKPKSPNSGLKVFVAVLSFMLVVSIGLSGVLMFKLAQDEKITTEQTARKKNNDDNFAINDVPKSDRSKTSVTSGRLTPQEIFVKASPSVVGIVVYVKQAGHQVYGQGSGVILTNDGYIVTNAHVVLSDNERTLPISKIEVVLSNGDYYPAQLIGTDKKTDIGVLKIDAPNLVAAEFGNSDQLEVGEPVVVIGNPDGVKFANSLTLGAISALNREVETSTTGKPVKYIQTDATINPGNSGGAMVNEFGQVVGIPVAKIVKTGFEGMGFAIPINDVKPIIDSIIENGYVTGRPKVGITYVPMLESLATLNGLPLGLRIAEVDENYDAYAKGVKKGDIITHMDGVEMIDSAAFASVFDKKAPGDMIEFTIYRVNDDGIASTIKIDVLIGEDKAPQ